ncbi:hypothetical protein D8B26_007082 [Coccidioides posadasii str. Silveira]|uniref:Ribosome biogenesis protein SLX9 n=1 Tax=Coccidioides posadasii (strain RMSCC 757 / Silveira) TaxID=443226 RepID=E9DJT8_COCPS|nr:conserved hypothetical protein [Coccidioides posadasii str. Silveira]QVM12454.1 hypothetical protein D8B26_007082 [Coccidioides posadasii str. Silveira]
MAPIRPKSKSKALSSSSVKKASSAGEEAVDTFDSFDSGFHTSKKDKRIIKHSAFVSKIEKSCKKPFKRRRPSKKLVANLDSLADALPDADDEVPEDAQVNIIRHKSLKHRPGAMKRKEKLDKVERDRFAKNMAQMATGLADPKEPAASTVDATQTSSSNRWAALRNFISQTIDQNPEFKR